jgi:hypothetical protein
MRHRVVSDGAGGWSLVQNDKHRPRSAAEIAAIMV